MATVPSAVKHQALPVRQFCEPSQAELGFQQALASLLKQNAAGHSTLLVAAFVAKYSCGSSGPYPLEGVINAAADLVHHG